MPVAGRQLSLPWALALGYHVGFRAKPLRYAVAVMTAESGRFVEAYNINIRPGGSTSLDRGLFQINTIHIGKLGMAESFMAIPNAEYAFVLSNGGVDFTPWVAYDSGAYERYLPEVAEVFFKEDEWRNLDVERELG
jgi:hypothetical protein